MTARFWRELPTTAFGNAAKDWIAVLPVAAIEQHGPHLPTGVDAMIAEGMVTRAAKALPEDSPAVFLPVQQVGKSNEHVNFAGTVSLSWETAIRAWVDIGESIARAGVRKLLIITSHGGNVSVTDIVARELRERHGMLVVHTSWGRIGAWQDIYPQEDIYTDIHGGLAETSLMLAMRPDLVSLRKAKHFGSAQRSLKARNEQLGFHSSNANIAWLAEDLNPEGPVGDASSATAELGEMDIAATVKGFAKLIEEIAVQPLPKGEG